MITGHTPFHPIDSDLALIAVAVRGDMPEKPIEPDPGRQIDVEFLWGLAISLCAKDPDQRPTIAVVVTRIQDTPDRAITAPGSNFNLDPRSNDEGKPIYLWHDHTHVECIGPLRGHNHTVLCMAFSPDSLKLASGSLDGTVRLWDAVTGIDLFGALKERDSNGIFSVAFSPGGSKVISGSSGRLSIWDAMTGAHLRKFGQMGFTSSSLLYSADESRIIMTSLSPPVVRTIDLQRGTMSSTSPLARGHGSIQAVGLSPDASQIAYYYSGGFICIDDVARGTRIETKHDLGDCTSLVYSPDGSKLAGGPSKGGLYLFDSRTLSPITYLTSQPLRPVAFSPDGQRLISGGGHAVRLFDVSNGTPISCNLVGPTDMVAIAISPDGSRIASGSKSHDKSVRIWVGTDRLG